MSAYSTRHWRLHRARGKAKDQDCVACNGKAQEWAQLKGADGESPDDYQPMCCPCHQKYDDHWSAESRAKVAASVKALWDASPERKRAMSESPHRLRARR